MQIFKIIKETIKLRKKTKEEKISLLISEKNTLIESSSLSKAYNYTMAGFFLPFSILPSLVVYLIHNDINRSEIPALEMVLSQPYLYLLSFIIPFSLLFYLIVRNPEEDDLLYELFLNVKLSYLIKNAKQINIYLRSTHFPEYIHGCLFRKYYNNHEYYNFLYSDIEHIDIFFYYLKENNESVFNEFNKLRKFIIEKNDPVSLEKLDTIYNTCFLNDDLSNYIKYGENDQDKEILDYLNIYRHKKILHMYFENIYTSNRQSNLENNNTKNTIDFNLLNRKEKIYANF